MARAKTKAKTRKTRRKGWAEGSNRPPRKRRSLIRRVVAGTTKGTGRLIAKGVVAGNNAVRSRGAKQKFEDGYMPEPDEIPVKAWHPSKGGGTCSACGKRFGSNVGLRRHFDVQHDGEEPAEKNVGRYHGPAAVRFERNRKKVVKTVRRKRATGPTGGRATTAGGRTMGRKERPVEIEQLELLKHAFEELGTMGTGGLMKMEAFASGLDVVFGHYGARAFEDYRLSLIHKEFPPEVLTGLHKIEDLMGEIAKEATAWIESLLKVMEEDIKAAKRLRKHGPSVGVLAG